MTNNTRTFWLSFANQEGCGGVVIIDLDGTKISLDDNWMVPAIRKSIELGINPGPKYEVHGQELPPDEIPERFKHRLLDHDDVDHLNAGVALQ
jgi:hypothetical protein